MKEEKLESILDTAKKMFARYGLRKTCLEEVARMARIAKATIYNCLRRYSLKDTENNHA